MSVNRQEAFYRVQTKAIAEIQLSLRQIIRGSHGDGAALSEEKIRNRQKILLERIDRFETEITEAKAKRPNRSRSRS